jgi:hypothetical protein
MAAGKLPKPGTKYGPCIDISCGHTDCTTTRDQAWTICIYCGKPIDYETRFYIIEEKTFVHATCHENHIESEQTPD